MSNHDFLRKYIGLQKDIMFDEVSIFNNYTLCFSKGDSHAFWNNALIGSVLSEKEIREIEDKLKELGRKPAFYFENKLELKPFQKLLVGRGYKIEGEDSAMFWDDRDIDISKFSQVKKVETEKDLDAFIKIFDQSYRKDDPKNPYGELGEYLDVARESWRKHHELDKLEYFVAYKNDIPVAVSTLTNHEGLGYISNVGSVLGVRGEGYGKLATLYCVGQSKKNGNKETFLLTEEGTNPNSFYDSLGFKTRFTVLLMVK
jgi:hypothetical protein